MIVQNAVICHKCEDFIFSGSRHSFVTCKCGAISVDGGQSYLRRVGHAITEGAYTDMSWEIHDQIYADCAAAVKEAMETNRNSYGIANAVMRVLRQAERIIADHEQRIMAYNDSMKEVMVIEPDGTVNRYKKVEE
jgi:hypothetical protein